jgi:hypothetical protein
MSYVLEFECASLEWIGEGRTSVTLRRKSSEEGDLGSLRFVARDLPDTPAFVPGEVYDVIVSPRSRDLQPGWPEQGWRIAPPGAPGPTNTTELRPRRLRKDER